MKAITQGRHFSIDGPESYGPAKRAEAAFGVLGSIARPAIPALTEIAVHSHDKIQCQAAVRSLAWIETDALPAFITILTKGTTESKGEALEYLAEFGTNVVDALPAIINCLVGEDGNIGDVAADILSRLDVPDAELKPILTNALVKASAPVRLRIYRVIFWRSQPSMREQDVRILQSALNDSNPAVRDFATNALQDLNSNERFNSPRPR
jgi:HEAT repeat protein